MTAPRGAVREAVPAPPRLPAEEPSPESSRRRGTAAVRALAAALSLAACGSGTDATSEKKAGAGRKDVARGGEDFGDAAARAAALGTDAEPGRFPAPSPTRSAPRS